MLDKIIDGRDAMLKSRHEPAQLKVIEKITKVELAKIIRSHTFADVKGETVSTNNLMYMNYNTVNVVFFGEKSWSSTHPTSVLAVSVTAHHNGSIELINKFNSTVKVGKAYKLPSIGMIFRHDIILAGGITEHNLMMQIRMFVELYYEFLSMAETSSTEQSNQSRH